MSTIALCHLNEQQWKRLPFIKRVVFKTMCENVPRRVKRIVFIASIASLLDESKTVEEELAIKLNSILKIVRNTEGLLFPMVVKTIIWKSVIKDPLVSINGRIYKYNDLENIKQTDSNFTGLANYFISKTPLWMIYGSCELMQHDISKLCNEVFA